MFEEDELIIWSRERIKFAETKGTGIEWEVQGWSYSNENEI